MLSENEIRPFELQKIQEKLYLADVMKFTRRLNEFRNADCPACRSTKHFLKYTKLGVTYSECTDCQTIFTNPRPTHSMMQEYYSSSENYKFWATSIFPATEEIRKTCIFMPRVELLEKLCREHKIAMGRMTEIGPGFGTFCRLITERGLFREIHAVEPTPELAHALEQSGISVTRKFVEDITLSEYSDVIVAFEVIEHILDPCGFIKKCHLMLNPGGLLFLTCPNGKGFDTLVLGEDAPALDFEHVTLFNPLSLSLLLREQGFSVVLLETPGVLDTDIVRNRIKKSEALRNKLAFYYTLFCEQWDEYGLSFQAYLQKNLLSGNLMMAAIKSA